MSLIPVGAGAIRATQLIAAGTGSGIVAPEELARFVRSPWPIATHLVGVPIFVFGGVGKFHPGVRRRWPRLHRRLGRAVVVSGLALAVSGAWMALRYDLPEHDSDALNAIRVIVSSAMGTALVLGVAAARRGDLASHRRWITRGWALGMGAATQPLTLAPLLLAGQSPTDMDPLPRTVGMGAAWVLNLLLAELWLRRGRSDRPAADLRAETPSIMAGTRS
ncbi:DUF2306 domain-containing protein [Euzebya tangerina]|uniref:DUF2306 domain-containing protein n=1 Tax=Euzebya tangerina TaxID=591198 RepID=UPI0013C2ABAB|nr:DUF2306 domain-containing protein [Euzebya tangerina]